jgi:dynein intermediate chain 1
MGVYAVRYSPFVSHVFLSASADWTVKLWDHDVAAAVMMFDLNSSVGDLFWSPVSSTIFSCVTADGKVVMYDLNESKFEPICDQTISKKAKMTHISFNRFVPVMLVGDDTGHILSMKLSPNLRKLGKASSSESQGEKMERVLAIAMGKRLEDKI